MKAQKHGLVTYVFLTLRMAQHQSLRKSVIRPSRQMMWSILTPQAQRKLTAARLAQRFMKITPMMRPAVAGH